MPEQTETTERTKLYELLYIVPNKYTEDEAQQISAKVNELITNQGGTLDKQVNYGKRRLAYPIQHNVYGHYLLHQFQLPVKNVKDLNKNLGVQDEILRHLITDAIPRESFGIGAGDLRPIVEKETKPVERKHKRPARPSRKKPTIADVAATAEEKVKMAKGTKFDLDKELGVTAEEAEKELTEVKTEKDTSEKSVDLDQLDSKLDEIMKDLE